MEVQKILERHVKVRKLDFRKKLNPEKEFACTALRVVFCSRYFKEKTLKKKIKIFATWRNSYYSTRLQNIDVISRFSRHVHHFPISCVTFFKSRVCPNSFFYLVEFCPNPWPLWSLDEVYLRLRYFGVWLTGVLYLLIAVPQEPAGLPLTTKSNRPW